VEIVGHHFFTSSPYPDDSRIGLEDFLRVSGPIVLFQEIWTEHGGPANPTQLLSKS